MDLATLRDHLHAAGWDALVGEAEGEVAARLEHPPTPGVWTIVLDRSGRFRFAATRDTAAPLAARLERSGRPYRLLLEEQETLTVLGQLDRTSDLPTVLDDLAELVRDALIWPFAAD